MKKILTLLVGFWVAISFSQEKKIPYPKIIKPIISYNYKVSILNGLEFYAYNEGRCLRGHYNIEVYILDKNVSDTEIIDNGLEKRTLRYDLAYSRYKGTNISLQGKFFKGCKNGFWKTTYKNKLVKTINYNHGLVIGRYRVYNLKGNILYKTTFGTKGNGRFEDYYYKTGLLKQEGNYRNGKKEGEWCDYDEQGNTKKITYYENGTPVK